MKKKNQQTEQPSQAKPAKALERKRGEGMRKLRRSECSVLHLVLSGRWYDMIDRGEKREEYRDVKDYYRTRIQNVIRRFAERKAKKIVVAFSRGRRKAGLYMTVIGVNIFQDCLHPEWGEPKGSHYVLALGQRVNLIDESEVQA